MSGKETNKVYIQRQRERGRQAENDQNKQKYSEKDAPRNSHEMERKEAKIYKKIFWEKERERLYQVID